MSQEYRNNGLPAIDWNGCSRSIVSVTLRKTGIPADRILEAADNWIAKNEIAGNQFVKGIDRRDWQD